MKKQKGGFQKIIGFSMVCCMLTNLAVPVSFAEETKKRTNVCADGSSTEGRK